MKEILAQANGHNGPIAFGIKVDNDKMTNIEVKQHSETPAIFKQVFGKLKESILEEQSFEVDVVSGATVMSKAILESGKQAVNQAGVSLPTPKPKAKKVYKGHVDVAVIGGGEAGLVAACRALSLGKRVALVEKNGYLGGATILNGSNVTATGSKVAQKIFGDNNDSPDLLASDVARECLDTNTVEMTQLMAQNIGDAIDFISNFADLHYQKAQTQTPEHSVQRQVELPSSSSYELITKVADAFVKKGGKIFLDSRVEEMLYDEDKKPIGFIAQGHNKKVIVYADAIVLASGGYGANEKMRGQENQGINYYGPMTSTGDAFDFLKELDLKTQNLDWYKVYPHGVQTEPGRAKLTTYASKKATDMGAIYVNKLGQRIVNESDVYAKLRNAVLEQPEKIAYLVLDEKMWQEFYQLLVLHDFNEEEIAKYFALADKQPPLFVKGTLSEVATKAGINPQALVATVTRYNEFAKAGQDSEFGRSKEMLHVYEGDVFYLVEQRDRFATTLGGFSARTDLRLQTKDGHKIANLYGAGEVVAGANGHDSMPSMMNTWGISSGYIAGTNAAKLS
ncbi:FAD-dependent oxidoreductase [Ligilactobacillus sp. Marseille-Q7487]|uniref:FAD-dependent oxidoreductase n=1 Tax=Ligilactobacillus sp. Marseille-Q7487 TaxID=3022128 RepID=UPI0024A86E24|nr:FAD-dependent oxidoreductase [Ligilactobacillus sp. Marseille-Q7487]